LCQRGPDDPENRTNVPPLALKAAQTFTGKPDRLQINREEFRKNRRSSKNPYGFFSSFRIGEVIDLDKLKRDRPTLQVLMNPREKPKWQISYRKP
jgi:hypothetical protein